MRTVEAAPMPDGMPMDVNLGEVDAPVRSGSGHPPLTL
jgi:hypothetical protein